MQSHVFIAVSMGDPGGIGPRLIAQVTASGRFAKRARLLVFGDAATLAQAAALDGLKIEFPTIADTSDLAERIARLSHAPLIVIEPPECPSGGFARGEVSPLNGAASVAWIKAGTKACLAGIAQALVTAPISKEAIRAAGVCFPGHTELLASLTDGCEVRMMLVGRRLRVVLETIHVALSQVPRLIEHDHLIRSLEIIHEWSLQFLRRSPNIAVCGLNPHAGENGQFGREEIEVIGPAIEQARKRGIGAWGPFPADTVFHRASHGEFDFVLSMYHDQGLGPLKTVAFDTGVNVTLGLPFVRTSPDHGTAFDRAWVREARLSCRSFEQAIKLALRWGTAAGRLSSARRHKNQ
ncbi:MAG: 4-hydroxythreonine-4-phosphate dehydrogenase PdxA [Candidatus Sumerlaeaceae bacterium]|jgi:4-hydroxythreonine-4-phosphate dehydrogenase